MRKSRTSYHHPDQLAQMLTPRTPTLPKPACLEDLGTVGCVGQRHHNAARHAADDGIIQVHGAVGRGQHQHTVLLLGAQPIPVLQAGSEGNS